MPFVSCSVSSSVDADTSPLPVSPDKETATQQLRALGLKPTIARLTVWQILRAANEPLSMQDMQRMVFEQNGSTPFNTLYMALRQMEEKGLVRRLRVDGKTRAQYVLAER